MRWLNLDCDGETVYQFARQARHSEVAHQLLAGGHAYKCFATPQELEEMRAAQRAARQPMRYDGRWRDRDPSEAGPDEIGRESCGERVCQYGSISGVAESLKKKLRRHNQTRTQNR